MLSRVPGLGATSLFLVLFLSEKVQFLYHPLPLCQAKLPLVASPPILRLCWKTLFPCFWFALCFSFWAGMGPRVGMQWGPLGSLHFYKSQINGLWCGILQALSSDHSHSHGLHRPSSGPVPHLQTPVMPALQTLWEAAWPQGF